MKFIDITLTYQPGMRGVKFYPSRTLLNDGWNAQILHLYSHAGTHMDAPAHFEVKGKTIDQVDPARFFLSCHIIELIGIQPGTEITVSHLGEVKTQLIKGEGLIFRTSWSQYVNDMKYRNGLPGLSRELALWCVEAGVGFIGVEPPSIADVTNLEKLTEIHRILLAGDILIVEGLTNLDKITKQKVQLVVLPLKIMNGDGAPCRAIVIED